MKLTKGMTAAQVEEMVAMMGWEVIEEEEEEAYDETMALYLTVLQGDHAVAVTVFHGVVDELEFVPLWAL